MDGRAQKRASVFALTDVLEHPLRWLPGLFLFPVELSRFWSRRLPAVTWGLAAAIFVVFALLVSHDGFDWTRWAVMSRDPFAHAGVPLLTHFFLHVGLFHMVANVYFLAVFGEPVEYTLGRRRFLLLVALSTVVGALTHAAAITLSPPPVVGGVELVVSVPMLGASGGVSGILAFYALRFREIRFGVLLVIVPLRLPVLLLLVVWLGHQVVGLAGNAAALSGVAFAAHLGGAAAGGLLWWSWKGSLNG